ncbi:MAG: chorismate-binding protein [Crocinitomicaceae bacterium]|nr:chorismate-binding protein [Crocinitomicaceae bacterium]
MVKRSSLTDLLGRGIVFCDFYSETIYQLEELEECGEAEWQIHCHNDHIQPTSHEEYTSGFEKLMTALRSGRFEKIVYTRTKKETLKRSLDEIFKDLNKNYLNTFNYFLSSPELGCWMGASPEKLCEIQDEKISAVSLAGTKNKSEKWTDKEIEEQLYVTRYIESVFKSLYCTNISIDGPHNLQAGPVQHLHTILSGTLPSREMWRKVIEDLHPTPATCGIPARKSKELIRDIEGYNRSLYTGFIGIFTDEFKQCYVNLRCMQILNQDVILYVGGGITAASEIEKEWQETERKARTLTQFL